jgi:hypothetical protein
MYTHRIMDITNQIVKQNRDIDKITADIRDIQKTINLNSSTLQRADAIAEELIFAVRPIAIPVVISLFSFFLFCAGARNLTAATVLQNFVLAMMRCATAVAM